MPNPRVLMSHDVGTVCVWVSTMRGLAQFAAVAKALAHPHRLELLEQLAQGELSVEVPLAPIVEVPEAQHRSNAKRKSPQT